MTDLTSLSIVEAADGVQSGAFSARELTEASLARIERLNPVLNAFIRVEAEGALAAADAADAAISAGDAVGSLHGVPLAHKDMFYRAGELCTCGSQIRRDFRPDVTATVIERLNAAGALYVGGLNMAEFAFGPTGHNEHWGHCRNAWNPDHITGGSSSGSGSATAARMVHGALGSDTGGSVRLPAAMNGLVGMKPTQTRVSRFGVMGLSFSLDNVGPLTRTVRDNARMLATIAGHDPLDATSSDMPVADYEKAAMETDIRGRKLGIARGYVETGSDPETLALLEKSIRIFEQDLGVEIVEIDTSSLAEASALSGSIVSSEAATLHGDWLKNRGNEYGAQTKARAEAGFAFGAVLYLSAIQMRARVVTAFVESTFSKCEVLFAPSLNKPVPTVEETDVGAEPGFDKVLASLSWCTRPFNYLTLPGLAVPAGFTGNGLPASFQLVGRPFAEATLYRFAGAYEAATDFSAKAPDL